MKLSLIVLSIVSIIIFKCQNRNNQEYALVYNVLFDAENDNYEVFSMDLDGSSKKNITNLPGVEWTYLAVKDRVYFISDKDTSHRFYRLYQCDYSGNNIKKISDIRLADSWMSSRANGMELIVRPSSKIDSAFYIIDLKGTLLQKLYTRLPFSNDPLFINNGEQVVFRGGKTKSKMIKGFSEELFIIDSNGENLKQLTHYPSDDTSAAKFAYKAGPPRQHPVEEFISYQSMQDGKYSLFAITPDGKKQWKLTESSQNEGWHDWSPDGKWLAIELFDDEQTQFHIALMNWETKEMKVLTDTTYKYQQAPCFVLKNPI
ncbi:MAG: PD40 domain-containing protein [Calditrichaeota bacterium]|nr:PD40 domain-containing protein [Calditrichota bacterium]